MRFTKFRFKNFRGIAETTLDLSRAPKGAVHVLIGLNESGKTTVLEGIDHFRANHDLRSSDPNKHVRTDAAFQAMVPIGLRANFNGEIHIAGFVEMDGPTSAAIRAHVDTLGYADISFTESFWITFKVTYVDSKRKGSTNTWGFNIHARRKSKGARVKKLEGDEWLRVVNFVETLLPKVMYFPSDLLNFPDEVRLEILEPKDKAPQRKPNRDAFYYQVLEDLLKAVDPGITIEKHVLPRFRSKSISDQQNLEALLLKAETHLNRTVLSDWSEIFGHPLRGKRFRITLGQATENLCFAQIKLSDGTGVYSLNERSAGFRWFFAFILLVRYRIHRNDKVLFLFDEPAANLHPRAQGKLLDSFSALSQKHQFIYSTHSHYLVNPSWLESTHVVKNYGLEGAEEWDPDPTASSITVTPYRQFVGSYPEQQFYYKAVMDSLAYSPPSLGLDASGILVEGKTDFYCLQYFNKVYFSHLNTAGIFPGGGASSLDPLIALLAGWGKEFVILVDSDAEGYAQRKRYLEKFGSLVEGRVYTIGELCGDGKLKSIESLFDVSDKELIRRKFYPAQKGKLSKSHLHLAIQELLTTRENLEWTDECLARVEAILKGLNDRIAALALT